MNLRDWEQAREHIAAQLEDWGGEPYERGASFIRTLKRPKPASTKATRARTSRQQEKAGKREAKNRETAEIRGEVLQRDGWKCHLCEGSEQSTHGLTLDHFWGRGKVAQAVHNCWTLCVGCHRAKTNNKPDRLFWLRMYRDHVQSWAAEYHRDPDDPRSADYAAEYAKTQREIEAEEIRQSLPASPRSTPNPEKQGEAT